MAAALADERIRELLAERDHEELREAKRLARDLAEGPCPVCSHEVEEPPPSPGCERGVAAAAAPPHPSPERERGVTAAVDGRPTPSPDLRAPSPEPPSPAPRAPSPEPPSPAPRAPGSEAPGPEPEPEPEPGLHVHPPPLLLRPFVRRPHLHCSRCHLHAPAQPTSFGWLLAMVLAVAFALGGISAIFVSQRLLDRRAQATTFAGGGLLFAGGLFVGYSVQGAGSVSSVAARIVHGRRRREGDIEPHPDADAGWFAENLEAVVVAIILALVIRHFFMEAFVIPTGSMAPTLLGDHFELECQDCGVTYAVNRREHEFHPEMETSTVTGRCSLCRAETTVERTRADVTGGHKILVNKLAYALDPPERYDVVVFKYPEEPAKNYIKRLVGLPGESIRVANGDVWADGRLARKPAAVQESIWIPVHDAAYAPRRATAREPAWGRIAGPPLAPAPPGWDRSDEARLVHRPEPGAAPTWLAYQDEVVDHYAYDRNLRAGDAVVADLRVRARATADGPQAVRLAVVENGRVVAGRFAFGSGAAAFALEVDGAVQRAVEGPALAPGRPVELEVAYADDRAVLRAGGEVVLVWDDPFGPARTETSGVRLQAEGAATFARPRIDRDVFYVPKRYAAYDPSDEPVRVPEGAYFVMGDNSPSSEDSRAWGFVRQGHLIGKAFLVFWPLVPFHAKLIR